MWYECLWHLSIQVYILTKVESDPEYTLSPAPSTARMIMGLSMGKLAPIFGIISPEGVTISNAVAVCSENVKNILKSYLKSYLIGQIQSSMLSVIY